jgi:hypothetical protein
MGNIRVAIVMGGGVSLGAFSGGALARVLEELSRIHEDQACPSVEIDVLTGASAGSLTLGLALNSLTELGGGIGNVSKTQRAAWVQRIGMGNLGRFDDLKNARSILNRRAVDKIALELMTRNDGEIAECPFLAPSVLFTCSLTNITGIGSDARTSFAASGQACGLTALGDPMTSTLHKDPRVFELHFKERQKRLDPLSRKLPVSKAASWLEIAGTAVASGAFPGAFEPVNLIRYRKEYPKNSQYHWHPYDMKESGEGGAPSLFSYVDGGVVDNEPMEVALTQCRLLDHRGPRKLKGDDRRLVIYIDPFMGAKNEARPLSFNREYVATKNGKRVVKQNELDRLLAAAGLLVGGLRMQAANRKWVADNATLKQAYGEQLYFLGIGPIEPAKAGATPKLISLAGKELSGFKGFLGEHLRDYDFKMGRYSAGRWVGELDRMAPSLGLKTRPAGALPKMKGDMDEYDSGNLKLLCQRARHYVDLVGKKLGLGFPVGVFPTGVVTGVLKSFVVPKALRRALEYRDSKEPMIDLEVMIEISELPRFGPEYGERKLSLLGTKKGHGSIGVPVKGNHTAMAPAIIGISARGENPLLSGVYVRCDNKEQSAVIELRVSGDRPKKRKSLKVSLSVSYMDLLVAARKAKTMIRGVIRGVIRLSGSWTKGGSVGVEVAEAIRPWPGE